MHLSSLQNKEKASLESMLIGSKRPKMDSILSKGISVKVSPPLLNICKSVAEKNVTSGLTWLSVIASTSPFIGLFGTVVAILDTFSKLGQGSSASISIIAPAISEALVATAAGIFVAIPAYTFYILLKRMGYSVVSYIERQIDILISDIDENTKRKDS